MFLVVSNYPPQCPKEAHLDDAGKIWGLLQFTVCVRQCKLWEPGLCQGGEITSQRV